MCRGGGGGRSMSTLLELLEHVVQVSSIDEVNRLPFRASPTT